MSRSVMWCRLIKQSALIRCQPNKARRAWHQRPDCDYSTPSGGPVANTAGPPPASRTTLQRMARKVLGSRSGGSRFVQNLHGSANVRDTENQQRRIRTCLDPAVGIVNVDLGFPKL